MYNSKYTATVDMAIRNKEEVERIYDTKMLCTYHIGLSRSMRTTEEGRVSSSDEEDYDETENQLLMDMLYKIQLLQLFRLDEENEKTTDCVLHRMEELYRLLRDNEFIKEIIDSNPHKLALYDPFRDDEETRFILFQTLFSFDYLYMFHKCMISYFSLGQSQGHLSKSVQDLKEAMEKRRK